MPEVAQAPVAPAAEPPKGQASLPFAPSGPVSVRLDSDVYKKLAGNFPVVAKGAAAVPAVDAPAPAAPAEAPPAPVAPVVPPAAPAHPEVAAPAPAPLDAGGAVVTPPADPAAPVVPAEAVDENPLEAAIRVSGPPVTPAVAPDPVPVASSFKEVAVALGKEIKSETEIVQHIKALEGRLGQAQAQIKKLEKAPGVSTKNPLLQVGLEILEASGTDEVALKNLASTFQALVQDPFAKNQAGQYVVTADSLLRQQLMEDVPGITQEQIEAHLYDMNEIKKEIDARPIRAAIAEKKNRTIAELRAKTAKQKAEAEAVLSLNQNQGAEHIHAELTRVADAGAVALTNAKIFGHQITPAVARYVSDAIRENAEYYMKAGADGLFENCFENQDGSLNAEAMALATLLFDRRVPQAVRDTLRKPWVNEQKIRDEVRKEYEQHLRATSTASSPGGLGLRGADAPPASTPPPPQSKPKTWQVPATIAVVK